MRFLLIFIIMSLFVFSCDKEEDNSKECNPACSSWQKCKDGKCVLRANKCESKDDCGGSEKCIDHVCYDEDFCDDKINCSGSKKCVDNTCYSKDYCDDEILCDKGFVCRENICIKKVDEKGELCTDRIDNDFDDLTDCEDESCKNEDICNKCFGKTCPTGESCNPETGTCVTNKLTTILEMRTKNEEVLYNTKGIVSAVDKDGFFMQDDSDRGIYVYVNKKKIDQKVGDFVYVSGTYKVYYGLSELYNVTVSTLAQNQDLPDFKEIDAANINNLEQYEAMLVRLKNSPFMVESTSSDPSNFDSEVKDKNNNIFTIRNNIYPFELSLQDEIEKLQGVLTYHRDKYKLIPRNEDDIKIKPLVCDPVCNDVFEECVRGESGNECKLKENMCDDEGNGCTSERRCEDNHCVLIEKNILINGDFEEDYDTDPDEHGWEDSETAKGWIFEYNNLAGTETKRTRTTEEYPNKFVHSGEFSAKIIKKDKETTGDRKPEYQSPKIFIDTSKQYNISMFLYDNDPNVSARVILRFFHEDENGTYSITAINSGGGSANKTVDMDSWKEYKYPFVWNIYAGMSAEDIAKISYMRVGVRLFHQTNEEGYIYIDDVRVEERE